MFTIAYYRHVKPYVTFFLIASVLLYSGICCPLFSSQHETGPLFVQFHFANPVSEISEVTLNKMLKGKLTSFSQMGGENRKISVYVHKSAADIVKKLYPSLSFKIADFAAELAADRSFIGISDVSGLSPFFKTIYIGNTLPWGKISDSYILSLPAHYPFMCRGIEQWDPEKHITFIQTGTTAMTRAFIGSVERTGDLDEPIKYTMEITSAADLASASNEVSFLEPCTYPLKDRMMFCSPKRYFGILEKSGFNVIELTGNHNNDYGWRHNLASIEMIEEAGMLYFGGGKDKNDAKKVRYKTVKGVRFAFLGFNQWGPDMAWATDTHAGAARLSETDYLEAVSEAVKNADVVVVSMQWGNEDNPEPHEIQKVYFRKAAEMGATILLSSSSHRAMGIEFHGGKFISYGLGNFLFDQMQTINHRRGMIARHHFYGKRHISTELIPYLMYNYSQPRPVRGREADDLMESVFRYSLGPVFR